MIIKHALIFTQLLFLLVLGIPRNIQKKVDKEIKSAFNVEQFNLNPVVITPELNKELPSEFGEENFFEIVSNNKRLGFAYLAQAPSKTAKFDYLVVLDNDLIVVKTKVLVYREEYGGEIGSKRWLRQFTGKTQNDNLVYKENVAAIAGATISVRSMTNAMNNLLKSLKILHQKQVL